MHHDHLDQIKKNIYKDGIKIVPQFLPLFGHRVLPATLQHENYLN